MRHSSVFTWMLGLAVFWAGALSGCQNKSVIQEKPLPDPLLTSKKPIEGKQSLAEAMPAAFRDEIPPPPPMPPLDFPGQQQTTEPPASVVRLLGVRSASTPRR